MARPKKEIIDYFPHMCNHGKTMFILEQKYGNDGYAFWFKLLEMLGNSKGHYLCLESGIDWEFLQAKTCLDQNKCEEMLDLLAKLDAIDSDLWSKKVVWSGNFVKGIQDVYKNRRVRVPVKPIKSGFYEQKPSQEGVSTGENPQTKLKETKLKETKLDKDHGVPCGEDAPAEKSLNKSEGAQQSLSTETVGNGDPRQTNLKKPQSCEGISLEKVTERVAKPVYHPTTLVVKGFDEFWAAYPRKVGKKPAKAAWDKLKPDVQLVEQMIGAVETAKKTNQWCREDGRFIPNPTTWLNQGRWEDELQNDGQEMIPRAYAGLEAWAAERNEANDSRRN